MIAMITSPSPSQMAHQSSFCQSSLHPRTPADPVWTLADREPWRVACFGSIASPVSGRIFSSVLMRFVKSLGLMMRSCRVLSAMRIPSWPLCPLTVHQSHLGSISNLVPVQTVVPASVTRVKAGSSAMFFLLTILRPMKAGSLPNTV
jgi:hypothetical protein